MTFCLRSFVVSASFNNVNDIETFVKKIQLNVQSIIQEAILMIKESEREQFFWSFKCSEIVTTIKKNAENDRYDELKKAEKHIWNSSTSKRKSSSKKKMKIQKNLWKIYNSDSVMLTFRSLSEIAKSQIEEDFQNFELDLKEQFKRNNTNC